MAKRPFVECILQLINLVLTLWGLGVLGFGLVCLLKSKQGITTKVHEDNTKYMIVHRLLVAIDPQKNVSYFDTFPKDWFIYLIIGIGGFLLILSLLGSVGTATRSPTCLLFYIIFFVAYIIVESGTVVFALIDQSWKEDIPEDKSGEIYRVYHFVSDNWKVIKFVPLGVLTLQVIAMLLAIYLRSVFKDARYDRDTERAVYIQRAWANDYNKRMVNMPKASPTPLTTTKVDVNANRVPTKPPNKTLPTVVEE